MKKLFVVLICFSAFFGIAKANPITLFDSLTGSDAYAPDPITDGVNYSLLIASFSTGAGDGFSLSDVILNLSAANPADGYTTELDIFDSSFNDLGKVGTLADSSMTTSSADYTFTPSSPFLLDPNSTYWVVFGTFDFSPSSAAWTLTDAWTNPDVNNQGIGDGYNGPYPYTNEGLGIAFEMQVDAAATPEPSSFLLGALGLAMLAGFRYRRVIS